MRFPDWIRNGTWFRRRCYVVDRRAQLGIALRVLAVVLGVFGMYALGVLAVFRGDDGILLGVAEVRRLMLQAGALYLGLGASLVVIVTLLLTHRYAGPAIVIRRALDGILAGDYGCRLSLRSYDHLKDVAARLSEVRDRWRRREETVRSGLDEVLHWLDRDDPEAARAAALALQEGALPVAVARAPANPEPVAAP